MGIGMTRPLFLYNLYHVDNNIDTDGHSQKLQWKSFHWTMPKGTIENDVYTQHKINQLKFQQFIWLEFLLEVNVNLDKIYDLCYVHNPYIAWTTAYKHYLCCCCFKNNISKVVNRPDSVLSKQDALDALDGKKKRSCCCRNFWRDYWRNLDLDFSGVGANGEGGIEAFIFIIIFALAFYYTIYIFIAILDFFRFRRQSNYDAYIRNTINENKEIFDSIQHDVLLEKYKLKLAEFKNTMSNDIENGIASSPYKDSDGNSLNPLHTTLSAPPEYSMYDKPNIPNIMALPFQPQPQPQTCQVTDGKWSPTHFSFTNNRIN